jgi:hypothetical protein
MASKLEEIVGCGGEEKVFQMWKKKWVMGERA